MVFFSLILACHLINVHLNLVSPTCIEGAVCQFTSVYVVFLSGSSQISRIPLCQSFFSGFFSLR